MWAGGSDTNNINNLYLGVINNPDSLGVSCNFVYDGLYLQGMRSTLNLPNLPNYNLAPLVAMVADAGPASLVVCAGDSLLVGAPDTTGGAVSFAWSGPGITDASLPQQLVSPSVSSWYHLAVTDSAVGIPCGVTRDSVFVVVANSGHFPVADAGRDTAICPGGTALLGITTASSYEFSWSHGPQSPQSTATQAGTYILTVHNPVGTGACLSDTDSVTVRIPQVPSPGFAGSDTILCMGDTVTLGTAPPPSWTVSWSPPSGLMDPFLSPVPASPPAGTEYILEMRDTSFSLQCAEASDTVQVIVEQPFTHAAPPALVRLCPGGCAVVGVPPVAGMTYAWSPAAGLDDAAVSMTVARPAATTTYVLTVTDTALSSAGCRELRFEMLAEVEVCGRQTMLQAGVGVLDLGPHDGVTELTVWDLQGRLVWFDGDYPSDPSTGSGTSGSGTAGFTAAGFGRGVYVYKVRRESEVEGESGCGGEWVSKLVVW